MSNIYATFLDELFTTQPGSRLHRNVEYSHSKMQCNTSKSQNQHKCRDNMRKKIAPLQFLSKPIFEMFLFPPLHTK